MPFIIGIEGGYGEGKTLTGVMKACQWSMASGAKIFANFPVRGAYVFNNYTDWYRIADLHGTIVIFDEAQSNFDNRQWNSKGQIEMTQVLNYVRKMNTIFIFILPEYHNADSRIRNVTDILIRQHKTKSGTILSSVYDFKLKQFGEYGKLLNKWVLPVSSQKKVFNLRLYSTHSMVHRFPTPPSNKVKDFFKELDRRHEIAIKKFRDVFEIETLVKEELEENAV